LPKQPPTLDNRDLFPLEINEKNEAARPSQQNSEPGSSSASETWFHLANGSRHVEKNAPEGAFEWQIEQRGWISPF